MSQQNPSPIISTVALMILAQLEPWAKDRGGYAKVVENESHLWEELLANSPVDQRPRVLIMSLGEKARGEYEGGERTAMERVDRSWMVVVMRGHGFKNLSVVGEGQPQTPGAIEPFSDSLETIRDGIRVLAGISEERPINYKGTRPIPGIGQTQVANIFLDCRAIEFDTAADIPAIGNGVTV